MFAECSPTGRLQLDFLPLSFLPFHTSRFSSSPPLLTAAPLRILQVHTFHFCPQHLICPALSHRFHFQQTLQWRSHNHTAGKGTSLSTFGEPAFATQPSSFIWPYSLLYPSYSLFSLRTQAVEILKASQISLVTTSDRSPLTQPKYSHCDP